MPPIDSQHFGPFIASLTMLSATPKKPALATRAAHGGLLWAPIPGFANATWAGVFVGQITAGDSSRERPKKQCQNKEPKQETAKEQESRRVGGEEGPKYHWVQETL